MSKKFGALGLIVYGIIVLFSSAAEASLSRLIEQLQVCEYEADTGLRLQCFDNIVAALPEPETVAVTPVAEKAVAVDEESDAFLDIADMWEYKRGMWKFRLVNGEVWQQTEISTGFPFETDRNYYFQKGMFEVHYLRTPGLNTRVRMKLAR